MTEGQRSATPITHDLLTSGFKLTNASCSFLTCVDNNNATIVTNTTAVAMATTTGDDIGDNDEHNYYKYIINTVVVPVLFGLVSFLGVVGNSLVIYVILSNQRMRTVTNFLLLNLALADLSFVIVIPPFTAYEYVESERPLPSWPFGAGLCKLLHYLVNVTAYVTVYTLVVISIVRYMTVVHSARTVHLRTKCNVIIIIVAIWVLMLALNVPILLSYGVTETGCDLYDPELGRRIFATFFAFAYVIPLVVICLFYLCILAHIASHRKHSMIRRDTNTKSFGKKQQAGRLLILVVLLFAILWLPIHTVLLIGYFGSPPDSNFFRTYSVLSSCFAYFNSCVNPIIYNRTSKAFREAFQQAVGCGRRGDRNIMILARLQPMDPSPGNCAPIVGLHLS